jgi:hypothetical protein
VSCDVEQLRRALRGFIADPGAARNAGTAARAHALRRFGLERFQRDWDALLHEVAA